MLHFINEVIIPIIPPNAKNNITLSNINPVIIPIPTPIAIALVKHS